jgi:hypothetical protein
MSPSFFILIGAAGAAFWTALEAGLKVGGVATVIGIIIGLLVAVAHIVLSRILGRWMLSQLERVKSSASIIRLSLAICFGLTFFVWWLAAPWSGDYLTKHALSLLGFK